MTARVSVQPSALAPTKGRDCFCLTSFYWNDEDNVFEDDVTLDDTDTDIRNTSPEQPATDLSLCDRG